MKDFHQWLAEKGIELNEKGKRTALSANYPSLYHSIRQQPRQTWTPISATAPLADKQIGSDEKVTDGGPNVTEKKDNPYKSFYRTEWKKFLNAKLQNEGPIWQGVKKVAGTAWDKMTEDPPEGKHLPPPSTMKKCRKMKKENKMHEIAPVLAAAGRAILPHVARAAGSALGTAAVNKMRPSQDQQQMKKHHKMMHGNSPETRFNQLSPAEQQKKRDDVAKLRRDFPHYHGDKPMTHPEDKKKCRKMMHQGDKPWMKTTGHPGKHEV